MIAAIIALGLGATPTLAATGSVYYDDHSNVGAGYEFFTAGVPGAFNQNVGLGYSVMPSLTAGTANTAIGTDALHSQTAGARNVAIGYGALFRNTTGVDNIALGTAAGYNLTTGSANILIGHNGVPGESNTIRIGNPPDYSAAYLAGVYGSTTSRGLPVVVDSSGKLGTQGVTAMLNSSDLIDRLRTRLTQVQDKLRTKLAEVRDRLRSRAEEFRSQWQSLRERVAALEEGR